MDHVTESIHRKCQIWQTATTTSKDFPALNSPQDVRGGGREGGLNCTVKPPEASRRILYCSATDVAGPQKVGRVHRFI